MRTAVATLLASLTGAVGHAGVAVNAKRAQRALRSGPPMSTAVASWYDYGGTTASGRSYRYGFASLLFGSDWGLRVLFCHAGRCAIGQLDDHGPYVAGRSFDLWPLLRDALACPDLCTVQWRVLR